MATGVAIPSHGGEQMVSFVKDADEKYCAPVSNFLGLKCRGASTMELFFEKVDGTQAITTVTLTTVDEDGVGFKRAAQAIAVAMGSPTRIGTLLEIADDVKGTYIHPDITAVSAVA